MPKRLPERCQPDSVLEFRESARRRYADGLALLVAGHRTGAIYLLGYAAEMTLKAAYFSLIGLADTDAIAWQSEIQPAIAKGRSWGIAWPPQGAGHNVRAWSDLLFLERSATPGAAYTSPFDVEVQARGRRISELWRETLRYHKNVAYEHEVERVRVDTEWFLANSDLL